ncbi:hypothetical protein D3C71_1229490 [compost metagenome]
MGWGAAQGALDDPADFGRGFCARAGHRFGGGLPEVGRAETDCGIGPWLHHVVPGGSGAVADPAAVLRRFHAAQFADDLARLRSGQRQRSAGGNRGTGTGARRLRVGDFPRGNPGDSLWPDRGGQGLRPARFRSVPSRHAADHGALCNSGDVQPVDQPDQGQRTDQRGRHQ